MRLAQSSGGGRVPLFAGLCAGALAAGGGLLSNMIWRYHWVDGGADGCISMKKLKHESELVKEAIRAGVKYGEERGVVEFEATDSANEKIEYIYRLLVHDKVIQPLPEEQVSQKAMRHRLAMWISRQLPKDHPLLQ